MATINLLPWRDEYRQEKKREFFSVFVLLVILAASTGYIWVRYVDTQVNNQLARNSLFNKEIAELDNKVKEIDQLKAQRADLESKMDVIQGLQNERPLIVYYFDELVKVVPDGVYFTSLQRKDNKYVIKGNSESNNRVSTLMRNLDRSKFFDAPNLKNVAAEQFSLEVEVVIPPEFTRIQSEKK